MQLIYFSPVAWASFRQRPHEFAHWAHERLAARVLWVEPYPVRFPQRADLARPAARLPATDPVPPWLEVLHLRVPPIEPWSAGRRFNRWFAGRALLARLRECAARDAATSVVVGKPSDLARLAVRSLGRRAFYDAMDDFPAFHHGAARRTSTAIERDLVAACAACSTSSTLLADRMRAHARAVVLVPNGLAAQRMPAFAAHSDRRDFGYVGTLGAWFDWAWVADLARSWPDRRIRLHGPLYRAPSIALPANVVLGPALPHGGALDFMAGLALGLVPFLRNELTASVDPVKYYEYRALGLPVASTGFGEMLRHAQDPRVVLTDTPAADRARLAALLAGADTAESVAAFRADNDWSRRFEPLAALLASP